MLVNAHWDLDILVLVCTQVLSKAIRGKTPLCHCVGSMGLVWRDVMSVLACRKHSTHNQGTKALMMEMSWCAIYTGSGAGPEGVWLKMVEHLLSTNKVPDFPGCEHKIKDIF